MTNHQSITEHFKISAPVPFIDVNAHTDTRLFVDPRAIRIEKNPSPYNADANQCTRTFFDTVTNYIKSSSSADNYRALELLQHFREPKQTRLGLAKSGINGHGGSEEVGQWIWETLSTNANALLRIGTLKWIEDIPLFVDGVGDDITSDLTTRIIFKPLAEFTSAMVAKYPEFRAAPHKMIKSDHQIWNPQSCTWDEGTFELPSVNEVPLLLVPKNWVRPSLLMTATRYYETQMLTYVQRKDASVDAKGKLLLTSKDRIIESGKYPRGRKTITDVTTDAVINHGADPLADFRYFVDSRYEPCG